MAVTLDVDGSVEKINAKLQTTRQELVGVANGYEQIEAASKQAVTAGVRGQDELAGATKKADKALKDQRGIIEKLEDRLKALAVGQRKAQDVKTVKNYNTEIAKTQAALNAVKTAGVGGLGAVSKAATASKGVFTSLRATLATTFAPLIAVGALTEGIRAVITEVTTFEQATADLQAITGANGDTLEFLKQQAVEVGVTTATSATDTIEAYKLIASAKPELLDNAAALAEITKEAVTLNAAMGGDLPTAATDLTDIMNQFSAEADEANRFVNALAAGSKEGSADIGQLASAIVVAGTEAAASNVSFEESVGLLETLAERGRKGAEAGTGLRNILSKLSATEVLPKDARDRLQGAGVDLAALSDQTLSFADRLRALQPIQNDSNALTAVFGLENKATAQILLGNIDRTEELTAAVTGTNVAYEQAAIRTQTAAGEFARLRSTISALVVEGGDGLGGLLAVLISFVREGILFMRDRVRDLKPAFDIVVDAVGGLVDVVRNLLPEQKAAGEGASLWTKAIKVLNVPIKIFFGLLAGGVRFITAVVETLGGLVKTSPALQRYFTRLRGFITGFVDVFINLPGFVSGGIAAIQTFVLETANSISQLGANIGSVLKEAFSFKKLLTEGTGDLNAAVADLLVNPFTGVGTKASEAFTKGFNEAQAEIEVKASVVPSGGGSTPTGSGDPVADDPSTSFIKPEDAAKAAKEAEKREQDIARTKLAAMQDGVDKALALEEARFTDLMGKLEKYGLDSSEAVYQNELNKFEIKQKFLADAADLEGLTGEERVKFLYDQTTAELAAVEAALREANGGELLAAQQAQLNLLRKQASEEYLAQVNELQEKETAAAQQHEINLLELRRSEFDTQAAFEEFKQKEILAIRLKYAEEQLALLEKVSGAESDAALALRGTINGIKGELAGIAEAGNTAKEFSLFSLIGVDPNDPENAGLVKGLTTAGSTIVDVLGQINAVRLQSAEAAVKAKDEEIAAIEESIEAKETELEEQEALAAQGFANNAEGVEQEIALLQEQAAAEKVEREKALAEKKKIQKQQAIVDTITQSSSLLSAAAQIFASVAAIPFVGPAIGAGLVAAMIGSFAAAKIKVFRNISNQKAERGLFKVIKGRRHSAGGEYVGNGVEAEDGEAMGILSRGATRRFGSAYEAFTNAANRGDRKRMARIAAKLGQGPKVDRALAAQLAGKQAAVVEVSNELNANLSSKELAENNALLKKLIKEQNKPTKQTDYRDGRKIETIGNSTRVTRKPRRNG